MTKQLYEEALADVKKLKEVAEDNAKKALIEAVAPRIKDLIEAELLREAPDDPETDDLLLDDGLMDEPGMGGSSIAAAAVDLVGSTEPDLTDAISMPDDQGRVTIDLDALGIGPTMSTDEYSMELTPPASATESKKNIANKLDEAATVLFESKLFRISENSKKFLNASKIVSSTPTFKKLVSEMVSEVEQLYQYLQESVGNIDDKELYENKLEKLYKDLNQLTERNMRKRIDEADLTFKVTGFPDEVEDALNDLNIEITPEEGKEESDEEPSDDADLDLDAEGSGEEPSDEEPEDSDEEKKEEGISMESRRLSDNTIVEIDEGMLRREIGRMKALREAADDVQSWGHGPGDVSDDMDFEDDDLGDPLELDVTTEGLDELDELDEMTDEPKDEPGKDAAVAKEMYQARDKNEYGGPSRSEQSRKQNRQVESLRHRLASEMRLQLEAKKKAKKAKMKKEMADKQATAKKQVAEKKKAAAKTAAQKGQGKTATQMKESALRDAKEAAQFAHQAKLMNEAYEFYAVRYNESVRRTAQLKTMLAEARRRNQDSLNESSTRSAEGSDKLREKLAETNLFNTKLLYTNKLLQNESLTKRQKADVIERLDEASTEREVKLVYESLVKTLAAPGRTSLSEAAQSRVLGSSSAPTRPASTVLSESYETDRWAKLAGIK